MLKQTFDSSLHQSFFKSFLNEKQYAYSTKKMTIQNSLSQMIIQWRLAMTIYYFICILHPLQMNPKTQNSNNTITRFFLWWRVWNYTTLIRKYCISKNTKIVIGSGKHLILNLYISKFKVVACNYTTLDVRHMS